MITDFLEMQLEKRKNMGILRTLPSPRQSIDLTSNDYFGFAKAPDLLARAQKKIVQIGATGSRLLTGNAPIYEALEAKISFLHKAESCLLFNTGYTANLGLISALGLEKTTFLYDIEIHASMIDGIRLSQAKSVPFRHNDLHSLEQKLKKVDRPAFVLVESIYSMSGDFAPLQEIAILCSQYQAALIVDEAHATGICGPEGMGYVVELGLESSVFARIHTFSKALGCHGACVVGSSVLKKYLLNFSRPWIYTTAMSLPCLFSIESSYEKMQKEAHIHQKRLQILIAYFQKKLDRKISQSPIQPIYVSGADKAIHLSKKIQKRGIDVRALVSPTIKKGKECLRVVLHSFTGLSDKKILSKNATFS